MFSLSKDNTHVYFYTPEELQEEVTQKTMTSLFGKDQEVIIGIEITDESGCYLSVLKPFEIDFTIKQNKRLINLLRLASKSLHKEVSVSPEVEITDPVKFNLNKDPKFEPSEELKIFKITITE